MHGALSAVKNYALEMSQHLSYILKQRAWREESSSGFAISMLSRDLSIRFLVDMVHVEPTRWLPWLETNYLQHFAGQIYFILLRYWDLFSNSLDLMPETPSDSNLERTLPSGYSRFSEVVTDIEEEWLGMYDWLVRFCCLASGCTSGI